MRILAGALLAVALTFTACGSQDIADVPVGTIRGVVLLGPTCPVQSATSPCPDQPLEYARVLVRRADGSVATTLKSDGEGRFAAQIAPGEYTLVVDTEGDPARTSKPVAITVRRGRTTSVTVPVDSGIR
jgi:carboxypeptidase family protein